MKNRIGRLGKSPLPNLVLLIEHMFYFHLQKIGIAYKEKMTFTDHIRPAKASCLSASYKTIETQSLRFMEMTSCFIGIRTLVSG